jgi:CheY-like chemotaxis protein
MDLPASAEGRGETVLLIEDDASAREGCALLLETMGYHVLAAGSGRDAVELFERHRADVALVLLDIAMPDMNGAAISRALEERGATVPIIVLSGYPPGTDAHGGIPRGSVGWLQKPFEVEQLARTMSEALHRSQ